MATISTDGWGQLRRPRAEAEREEETTPADVWCLAMGPGKVNENAWYLLNG